MAQAFEYEDVPVKEESKETKDENTELNLNQDTDTDEGNQDEVNFSAAEEKARKDGWVPQDEWKGDPETWVDHKEFNIRGELMGRIKSQSHDIVSLRDELKENQKALRALGDHHKKTAEREYEKAIKEVRKQIRDAKENDEYDVAEELEDQMDELKDAKKELQDEIKDENKEEEKAPQISNTDRDMITSWIEKNQWYTTDEVMNGAADAIMMRYFQSHPNDVEGALEHVDKKMREKFPDDSDKGTKQKKGAVTESDGRRPGKKTSSGKTKYTKADLTEDQLSFAKTFVSQGIYKNVQEYVDELAAIDGIEK